MNAFKNTVVGGLLTGASMLTNVSATEAAPADGASLAEALGLPIGGPRFFWNEATQTSGRLACEVKTESVQCTFDASSALAQIDYRQIQDIRIGVDGKPQIETSLAGSGAWEGDYRKNTHYKEFYQQATKVEWAAGAPLAQDSSEGIVQNNIKMVEAIGDQAAKVSSDVPVSDQFGIRLSTVFDGSAYSVSATALPRVALNGVITEGSAEFAGRDMTKFDPEFLDRNLGMAKEEGGRAFRSVVAQTP